MNSANFHEFLKNPSMLHQVSYQELKSLALQYPFAANLRYLLLIKSYLDNNGEQEKNLALASLSSIDRKKLMQLVARFKPSDTFEESFSLEEDFLELKDLNVLEDMPVVETEAPLSEMSMEPPTALEDMASENGTGQSDTPVFDDSEDFSFLDALLEDNAPDQDEPEGEGVVDDGTVDLEETLEAVAPEAETEEAPTASGENLTVELDEIEEEVIEEEFTLEEIFKGAAALGGSTRENEKLKEIEDELPDSMEDLPDEEEEDSRPDIPSLEDLEATPPPTPASWLDRVKKPEKGIVLDNLSDLPPVPKKSKRKKRKKDAVKKVATKSILEDNDIATETLARLLERQGYHDKAIDMYERLKEKFPERSGYFGEKIEALKKLRK